MPPLRNIEYFSAAIQIDCARACLEYKRGLLMVGLLTSLNAVRRSVICWTALCLAMAPAYMIVFWLDMGSVNARSVLDALISVVTLWGLGLAFAGLIRKTLEASTSKSPILALLPAQAIAFAFAWYIAVASTYGWVNAGFSGGGAIPSFAGPAFRWQIFQGLIAAAALMAMIDAQLAREHSATALVKEPTKESASLLLRDGDEMVRIDPAEIVSIIADNDEASVNIGTRVFSVRRSLKEFEAELAENFVRIHRSTIINFSKIERVEPAGGGRMTVHLADGTSPTASKAGARLLRARAI